MDSRCFWFNRLIANICWASRELKDRKDEAYTSLTFPPVTAFSSLTFVLGYMLWESKLFDRISDTVDRFAAIVTIEIPSVISMSTNDHYGCQFPYQPPDSVGQLGLQRCPLWHPPASVGRQFGVELNK